MLLKPTKKGRNCPTTAEIFNIFSTLSRKSRYIFKKSWKILDYPLFLHYKFATIKI